MLELQNFLIKEKVGLFKSHDEYDIFDPETGEQVGKVTELPGTLVSVLRWIISKKLMPTKAEICEYPSGSLLFTIKKPVGFFRETVEVFDAQGVKLGFFKSKILSIGGGFYVYDKDGQQFAEVKGKWTGWEFKFLTPEGHEMGKVSKKWAGVMKELFTSADNYVVSISDDLVDQPIAKMLLLAATIAIDMVYYEQGG